MLRYRVVHVHCKIHLRMFLYDSTRDSNVNRRKSLIADDYRILEDEGDPTQMKESGCFKTSLTFKSLIEHLVADFSYSRPLDTYL